MAALSTLRWALGGNAVLGDTTRIFAAGGIEVLVPEAAPLIRATLQPNGSMVVAVDGDAILRLPPEAQAALLAEYRAALASRFGAIDGTLLANFAGLLTWLRRLTVIVPALSVSSVTAAGVQIAETMLLPAALAASTVGIPLLLRWVLLRRVRRMLPFRV